MLYKLKLCRPNGVFLKLVSIRQCREVIESIIQFWLGGGGGGGGGVAVGGRCGCGVEVHRYTRKPYIPN